MSRQKANPYLVGLYVVQEGMCFHCNKIMHHLQEDFHVEGWTREHILPLSYIRKKGMEHPKYNVVLAHRRCNQRRGSTFPTKQEVKKYYQIYKKVLNF